MAAGPIVRFIAGLVITAVVWLMLTDFFYTVTGALEQSLKNAFPQVTLPQVYDSLKDAFTKIVGGMPYFIIFMLVFGTIAYAYRIASGQQYYY